MKLCIENVIESYVHLHDIGISQVAFYDIYITLPVPITVNETQRPFNSISIGHGPYVHLRILHTYQHYMYFFFLDELRKFTISDFPKQQHLGYFIFFLHPLIDPHFTKMFLCWLH